MFNNPKGGLGYAAEFQSSALPWVTSSIAPASGSPVRFDFPKITRFITVSNTAVSTSTLSFGFTRLGLVSSSNKYILSGGQSISLEYRVKMMFLQGENGLPTFNVAAGLTNIDANQMPALTGTFPNGDPGWIGVG